MTNRLKVCDLHYERGDAEALKKAFDDFFATARNAHSAEEILNARESLMREYALFSTYSSLAYTRYTLNTEDAFYVAEQEYYDQTQPEINALYTEYSRVMLDSPFASELRARLPETLYPSYELSARCHSPETISLEQRENALVLEYSNLMSTLTTDWQGEQRTISYIRGFLSDDDRSVRRAAACAIGRALSTVSDRLDSIYDQLVRVRTEIAHRLGFDNFVQLGYCRMGRIDYNEDMVSDFRNNVLCDIIPLVSQIKADIKEKLHIDRFSFYDDSVIAGADPRPYPDAEGILGAASEMYHHMNDSVLGDFFDQMRDAEAFDTLSRKGKWGGGYATSFDVYRQPFILANFNGSSDDVDVITHEFGHTVAMNFAFDHDYEAGIGSSETAETHSMSMEFFAWKYMDKFFKDPSAYCRKHLTDALSFLPYGTLIDEFQHLVYSHPDMSPAERNRLYLDLEAKYRPYMTFEDIDYLSSGTRWQYQMHVYETPFYYIDYCLAQVVALEFLEWSERDYAEALDAYIAHARRGGTYPFNRLVSLAGLRSPFEAGALAGIANISRDILSRID